MIYRIGSILKGFVLMFSLYGLQEVYAQSGPGGVGNSTTNELWLRADSGVYSNSGTTLATNNDDVEEWHDVSGNGNDAIETTGAFQPTYQTNQVNGFPVLDFDGNNDRILSSGVSTNSEATVIALIKVETPTNNNDGIIHAAPSGQSFSTSANNKSIGMWYETATGEPWGRGVQSNNSSRSIPSVTSISTGSYYVITNDYDGSDITQYINGATAGSISYNGTLKDWSEFGVGRQGNESFNGDIAEIIAYTVTLNDAQLIIVQNYLKAKYGITLTSNNIYDMDTPANGDFDFEVAGIGRVDASNLHTVARGSGIVQVTKTGGGLGNNEFLFWGHDNGELQSFGYTDVPGGVQARLGRIWRVAEQGEPGSVEIAFDLTGLGPVTTSDLRLLIDEDQDGDFTDATIISGATSLGGNLYEFDTQTNNALEDGDMFTIATINTSQTPLPITLVNFEVQLNGDVVDVSWATESEINNDFFTLERSMDARNWDPLATIDGAGNSTDFIEYLYRDASPMIGYSYYRLKQTDFNGDYSYSEIEVLSYLPKEASVKTYPNPVRAGDVIHVNLPEGSTGEIECRIYTSDGRLNYQSRFEVNESNSIQFIVPNQPGTYILHLESAGVQWKEKILVE